MTNNDACIACAHVVEQNPRYLELAEKYENGTITPEEFDEMDRIFDDVFFSPFQMKNFLSVDEEDNPEEDARIKAEIQSMIDRGVISAHPAY